MCLKEAVGSERWEHLTHVLKRSMENCTFLTVRTIPNRLSNTAIVPIQKNSSQCTATISQLAERDA